MTPSGERETINPYLQSLISRIPIRNIIPVSHVLKPAVVFLALLLKRESGKSIGLARVKDEQIQFLSPSQALLGLQKGGDIVLGDFNSSVLFPAGIVKEKLALLADLQDTQEHALFQGLAHFRA